MFFTVFPFFYAKRSNSSLWSSIFLKIDMIDLWKRLTESRSNRSILWSQKNEWCHRKTDDWIPNPGLTSSLSRTVLSLTYISLRALFFRSCPIAQTVFPWGVVKWKGGGGRWGEGGRKGRKEFQIPSGIPFLYLLERMVYSCCISFSRVPAGLHCCSASKLNWWR